MMGVADGAIVARSYFNDTQLVLIGSFLLAIALERVQLHRRVAHYLLDLLGSRPFHIISGFAMASCAVSTLLSNTATTIIVLPMAQAVLIRLQIAQNDVHHHCPSLDAVSIPLSLSLRPSPSLPPSLPLPLLCSLLGLL